MWITLPQDQPHSQAGSLRQFYRSLRHFKRINHEGHEGHEGHEEHEEHEDFDTDITGMSSLICVSFVFHLWLDNGPSFASWSLHHLLRWPIRRLRVE